MDTYCQTKGCPNKESEGIFKGEFCKPCYEVYTTGLVHERYAETGRWYGVVPRLEFFATLRYGIRPDLISMLGEFDKTIKSFRKLLYPGEPNLRPELAETYDYDVDDSYGYDDEEEDDTMEYDTLSMGLD